MSSAIAKPDAAIDEVILVDSEDREMGRQEKLAAHRRGALHRAFSVMIWDDCGRMLLQRRAPGKYHSAGLWTNACCGHPRPGEEARDAANRRLHEEMGFRADLSPLGAVTYRAELGAGMVEHEVAHIFRGRHDGAVAADPLEVSEYAWLAPEDVRRRAATEPDRFTEWFKIYLAARWPVAAP